MKIFAYCTEAAREAVAAATGVEPVTSPPMTADGFDVQWMARHDVVYFRLHRIRERGGWYGEGVLGPENHVVRRPLALVRAQLRGADLGGAVCVVANCFGGDGDPMVTALYKAGASVVIAGPGENLALGERVVGTDLLVQWVIRGMRWGMRARRALDVARVRLALTAWRRSDRDAMGFRVAPDESGRPMV